VPVISAVHASPGRTATFRSGLARALRVRRRRQAADDAHEALVRALCHDMRGPLASIAGALGHLGPDGSVRDDLLALAQASTAQLASMLRTVEATGNGASHRPATRRLGEVVAGAVAASGLPLTQLTLRIEPSVTDVAVGDARLQRILWNLLENAHRHGDGAPVVLDAVRSPGWVQLSLTQSGLAPGRLVDHLSARRPPAGVTGLGLWSVQRQTRELGGQVLWDDDGAALTLRLLLPDR
jgi:signal transduction histidine kinase